MVRLSNGRGLRWSSAARVGVSTVALALGCFAQAAWAQPVSTPAPEAEASDNSGVEEIVVTAQKRSQSINDVGISITAASANALQQRGVANVADLVKVVPGFTYARSAYSTPVYTLRGVGLYDSGFASSPAVSVYVDQIPLAFPVMTTGANLDLERVEVLKGPQGTLFGQNSTGGAINYIAAKPTKEFQAGFDASYERFDKADIGGFVSGPITDTLSTRIAARMVTGGAWQYSVTRPGDENGATRQLMGRILTDWTPTDRLKFELNVNANRDRSDAQYGQLVLNTLNIVGAATAANPYAIVDLARFAALTNPASPGFDSSFLARQATVVGRLSSSDPAVRDGAIAYLSQPAAPNNARAADWTPGYPTRQHDSFWQASLRGDYKITDDVTLTSITSYAHQKLDKFSDLDATTGRGSQFNTYGYIKAFDQELRISGDTRQFQWTIGANYDHARTADDAISDIRSISLNEPIPGLPFGGFQTTLHQRINTYAAFASGEYRITPRLTVLGGIRYTRTERRAANCAADISANQNLSTTFTLLQQAFHTSPIIPIAPGQCYALTDFPNPQPTITPYVLDLNENNVSWRTGVNYKLEQGTLLYASVSQGYKAGVIVPLAPSVVSQYAPAKQEKLISYEVGFKAPLADRRIELNVAAFYYSYTDKQVRSHVADPIFGLLEKVLNVPKSRVWGLEGELVTRPFDGLTISAAGTYLNSKVTSSFSKTPDGLNIYNGEGFTGDFKGARLPYTPKVTLVADGQYQWLVGDSLEAHVGSSVNYNSKDNATFENDILFAGDMKLKAYTTLDLRAGIGAEDGGWQLSVFGRNVTNTYYTSTAFQAIDTIYKDAGMPATYGVSLKLRTR